MNSLANIFKIVATLAITLSPLSTEPIVNDAGDSDAGKHELNWMISIQYPRWGELKHRCGGSIISNRLILTAAHCLYHSSSNNLLDETAIRIAGGSNDLRDDWQSARVDYIAVHPLYDNQNRLLQNDIAILRLKRSIKVNTLSQGVIGLPSSSYQDANNANFVAGWGSTQRRAAQLGHGSLPRILKKASVTVISRRECVSRLPLFTVTSDMICTDSTSGDVCQGDSGGALYETYYDTWTMERKYRIHGIIVGSSDGCALPGSASIHCRVASYLDSFILPALQDRETTASSSYLY